MDFFFVGLLLVVMVGGKKRLIVESLLLDSWFENLERAHQSFIHAHHCSSIIELVTIVRGRENSDELSLGKEFVSVFNDLMRSADQIKIVFAQELFDNVSAESEGDSSVILTPSRDSFFGIGPKQIAEKTRVGNVRRSRDLANLLHGVKLRAQSSMHAEDFFVNDGGNRHAVEAVRESFPELDAVSSLAFVVKTINSVDGSALVVSTQDEKVFRIFDFVSKQKTNRFQALFSTVDVISQEQIVGLGRETSVFKEAQKVVILAMNITANFNGCFKFEKRRLGEENLSRLENESANFGFCQLDLLSWSASTNFEQFVDDCININVVLHD
jgi:hypothetical protein